MAARCAREHYLPDELFPNERRANLHGVSGGRGRGATKFAINHRDAGCACKCALHFANIQAVLEAPAIRPLSLFIGRL